MSEPSTKRHVSPWWPIGILGGIAVLLIGAYVSSQPDPIPEPNQNTVGAQQRRAQRAVESAFDGLTAAEQALVCDDPEGMADSLRDEFYQTEDSFPDLKFMEFRAIAIRAINDRCAS